jgi:branched-chain amino acid transport system permease protein
MAVVGGITTVTGALIGGSLYALLLTAQAKFPKAAGIVFLAVGVAAVALGRNPNGIAFFLHQQGRKILPKRRASPPMAEPIPPAMEEVSGVAASAG